MPFISQYCLEHPDDEECYYGDGTYNGNGTWGNSGGGGGNAGNVTIMGGGATTQGNTLNQVMQAILSGLAIFQHQPYVPTQVQPQQQPIIYQQPVGGYGNVAAGGSNAFGGIQQYIQQHPMAVLAGAGAIALLLFKPPIQRAR